MKTFLVIIALGCLSGCGDFIPFPSGELRGYLTAPPDDWSELTTARIIELETNPSAPYSVKLWIIGFDDHLYVHAGDNLAEWVKNMEADPAVKLLIDDQLFELTSWRVSDQAEFDEFAKVYEDKYGNRPRNENVSEAYLYRLAPRP